ncbi:D-alanyl-D-alanine-carboxypeptidase/endopeptidase AmpH [Terracidiphilus gabretensis]|uniref:D-alanyl-D-alanine- carboxypeptidase/endopeptidase AmpH n=1 Tax=Terracidiphilus gabretensis TaxID=1577687 RepID=UPI00071BF335|nr:D-alanyl-D-alanine-carboxypeptidase/endopeptidase AmpH [Terracidiphilus gabretensis]
MKSFFKILTPLLVFSFVPVFAQVPAPLYDPQTMTTLGDELFRDSGATGLVLVIVHDNQVFFHGYGETAPGSHQIPTRDSVVRICSLTKIFTADLLTKLVAGKTVKLTDPLQRFAPPHTIVPKRVRAIMLSDLATHTSGLPREVSGAPRNTPHFTFPDYATRWRWLPDQHLSATPGTAALYSNVAYDFLGDALQSAAHQQYAALLTARTLKPLRMYNTTYFPTAAQCNRLLHSGSRDDGPCTSTEESAGSSGLYSTASDMEIWLKYLLGTGAPAQDPAAQGVYIQASNLVRQQGLDRAGEPTGLGLGWMHLLPPSSPSHIVEKTGGGAGFVTYIAINHARNAAIFFAATDGPSRPKPNRSKPAQPKPATPGQGAPVQHVNLFYAANNLLLTVSGLPPLPPPPPRPAHGVAHKHVHAHSQKKQ